MLQMTLLVCQILESRIGEVHLIFELESSQEIKQPMSTYHEKLNN